MAGHRLDCRQSPSRDVVELRDSFKLVPARSVLFALLAGAGSAVAVLWLHRLHSAANHLLLNPIAQMLILLTILPVVVISVFDRSERATREWVSTGLDLDLEVLQLVVSDHFAMTRFGEYLRKLRERFPGRVVAGMYCLLRLELELAVQANALGMARGAGLPLQADEDLDAILAERHYLQQSIGRTGLLALRTSAGHDSPRSVAPASASSDASRST